MKNNHIFENKIRLSNPVVRQNIEVRFEKSPTVYCDNNSAIFKAENSTTTPGSRHITHGYLLSLNKRSNCKRCCKTQIYTFKSAIS